MQMLDSILTLIVIFYPVYAFFKWVHHDAPNAGTSSKPHQASRGLKRHQFSRCRSPVGDEKFPRACI
ncbi:hypothetical protein [Agrobacterium pusense]|uniref:hypothetical protein n=1 Tax=Agrobacterium pusense TaxID=648995 RepID=UPI00289A64CC|nr:hypothetical protein [Agrobacterium pusense]